MEIINTSQVEIKQNLTYHSSIFCNSFHFTNMLKTFQYDNILFQGTPLQNSLLELFALRHFIDPIEFPDPESESKLFSGLHHSEAKISQIHDLLKPRFVSCFVT